MSLLPKILSHTTVEKHADLERSLLRYEAELGGKLFGPLPQGRQRQFFCLDEHTWIWHETWQDKKGKRHSITTRYYVRPNGILKAQDGQPYQPLSSAEARNFFQATNLYLERVSAIYQQQLQSA